MAQTKKQETGYDLDAVVRGFSKEMDKIIADQPPRKSPRGELSGNPVSIGERVIEADRWAKKQVERASAAADDWLEGVTRPKKNPIDAAIKAADKYKDRLQEAIKTGKWEKAMEKVDIDEMYRIIEAVGASGYRAGVEARKEKIERVVKELQPMVRAIAETIDKMPQATDADREKRLLAARKLMIELGKKRRGIS